MIKSCGWPHQLILNLFLVAAQYNFFIVIFVLCFSTAKFSYVTQNSGRDHWRSKEVFLGAAAS